MNNIKRRAALRSFLSIAGAALVSVAALPLLASAQAIDQLGVPGPIHFDGKVFGLAWSSKPSAVR